MESPSILITIRGGNVDYIAKTEQNIAIYIQDWDNADAMENPDDNNFKEERLDVELLSNDEFENILEQNYLEVKGDIEGRMED